jgi:hypothetical protein
MNNKVRVAFDVLSVDPVIVNSMAIESQCRKSNEKYLVS